MSNVKSPKSKVQSLTSILLIALAATAIFGCVTTKKKGKDEKVGWFKKGYHNLTSHYNYWFNADELMRASRQKLNSAHKDNYNQILEIYPYMAADPQAEKGNLDNVITKASKAVVLHRVSGWSDDCYLLVGQAQLMKHDFETAEATFQYIKEETDPAKKLRKAKLKKGSKKKDDKKKKSSKKKKKKKKPSKKRAKKAKKDKEAAKKAEADDKKAAIEKKKKEEEEALKPTGKNPYESGTFSRTSAFPESMIWYGRTLTEREKFEEAEYHYSELWADPFFPNKFKDDLAVAEAYNWLRQKQYAKAIAPLEKGMKLTKKKKERARLAYILAQLYEKSGNYDQAYTAFQTVLSSSPTFEMEFNARLHQIASAWENGKMSGKEADRTLSKMLDEAKYSDFRDQIYFTLATISLKQNMKPEAIEYLRKSLAFNTTNAPQRAESYLKLAELYFDSESFVNAKNYYDSTLTVLPATDPRYAPAENYAKNLTDIARLIQTIAANDSIINIYKMSDGEKKDFAKKIRKQREEEASKTAAADAKSNDKKGNLQGAAPVAPKAGLKPSTFYFYNEAFVKKGKKDFAKAWGERKLEDNWRRSNKRPTDAGDEIAAADSTANPAADDAANDDIFQTLPKSDAELAVLHASNYDAMYNLGVLFRDKLQNYKRSAETLENQLSRYPDSTKFQKETWYYCFLDFTDLENPTRAKFYYDKLVEVYPNSAYARAISDPNFLKAQKQREQELNEYYKTAYGKFQTGEYKTAFDQCEGAPRKFGSQNPLMPKFALLSALCTGNLKGQDAYCQALNEVIGKYPNSEESTKAKEIARLMSCKGFEVTVAGGSGATNSLDDNFTLEDDKLHYFMLALDNSDNNIKLDEVKAAISDYNREFHKLEQLRISNIFLGTNTTTPIIVIRKFDTRSQAMAFLKEVEKKSEDFLGEKKGKPFSKEFFVVTQENYRRVLRNRTLDGYREFFSENYLK